MMPTRQNVFIAVVLIIWLTQVRESRAHFVWASFQNSPAGARELHVYMSETASPERALSSDRFPPPNVWLRQKDGNYTDVSRTDTKSTRCCDVVADIAVAEAKCLFGVFEKGDKAWLMNFYAKAINAAGLTEDNRQSTKLDLDIVPTQADGAISVSVKWKNKPAADCQVIVKTPDGERSEQTSDRRGVVKIGPASDGRYEIRARMIEEARGVHEGKKYDERRHYSTLTLAIEAQKASPRNPLKYPRLPRGITSFGGAIIGDWFYTYGGHFGRPHRYHNKSQSNQLSRMNLATREKWEVVAKGPRLQGLALVAHQGILYRIGGFQAMNDDGDDHDLRSVDDFTRFDPKIGEWERLAPLPEPRSSHDAVVIGDKLYVVGGWQLDSEEKVWHETAWVADLSRKSPKWTPLPKPPFQRRALSVAHLNGHLFAIGGMQKVGGPTTSVDKLNLQTGVWTSAGALVGEGMEGFGSSAFTVDGLLCVTTYGGNLQVLESEIGEWRIAATLDDDRFFHRMLPYEGKLVLVGGANMVTGKWKHVEAIDVPAPNGGKNGKMAAGREL